MRLRTAILFFLGTAISACDSTEGADVAPGEDTGAEGDTAIALDSTADTASDSALPDSGKNDPTIPDSGTADGADVAPIDSGTDVAPAASGTGSVVDTGPASDALPDTAPSSC